MSLKHRPTRRTGLEKPPRPLREQYLSLMAKRPLLPADITRLELWSFLIYEGKQNASK